MPYLLRSVAALWLFFSIGKAQWEPMIEPPGEPANSFAVMGTDIFSGTRGGGVFRSGNGGDSWIPVNFGLTNTEVCALAASGSMLFAGTSGGGIFRSQNNGNTWTAANYGLAGRIINRLFVKDSSVFALTDSDLFRSQDSGNSWTLINKTSVNIVVNSAAFLSFESVGSVLLARVGFGGIFRSLDNGGSWSSANTGLSNPNIPALFAKDSTLFAGTKGGGVFRSKDGGRSWADVNVGISNFFVRLIFESKDSVFALTDGGIFRSTNNGDSWALTDTVIGLPNDAHFSITRSGSDFFVVNETRGLFRSRDNGRFWTGITNGISGPGFRLLSNAKGPELFALAFDGRLFRSQDNGSSWGPLAVDRLANTRIASFAVAEPEFLVGTQDSGIYRNKNGSNPWERSYAHVRALALYVGDSTLLAGTDNGLLRSENRGDTWAYIGSGAPSAPITSFSGHGLYAFGVSDNAGVYRSQDRGVSWTATNVGLTSLKVVSIAAGNADVFAGTDSGVFRSRDFGLSWTPANNGISSRRILSLAQRNNEVYAGTSDDGIYHSQDFGSSWTRVNDGLVGTCIQSLFIKDSLLFARVAGTGHWKSRISGLASPARPQGRISRGFRMGNLLRFGDPIRFSLAVGDRVRIDVFDSRGKSAGTLLNGFVPAGVHEAALHFNGSEGVYFLRMEAGKTSVTRRFVLER